MANNKTLELSIKIAGKMDKSLMAALNGSQSQISSFARSISSIGTAGLAAMGTLATATVATIASCTKEAAKFENYMAITRAEQNCVLSYAKSRYRNGKTDMCTPSRFLKDIDAKYLDMPSDAGASDAFASARERYGRPAFASPFRQPRAVEDDFEIGRAHV